MNDPTGLALLSGSDTAGTWHIYYQYNPLSAEWGNMSWGHAQSTDLVHWTLPLPPHMFPDCPALTMVPQPGEATAEGVFSGCVRPWPHGDGHKRLVMLYTAISRLPLHWTLPYVRGTEKVAVSTTEDGSTILSTKLLLSDPPQHLDVTAWRDPFEAVWPALRSALGQRLAPHDSDRFALLAGGLQGKGPCLFLYAVGTHPTGAPDYTRPWTYEGLALRLPLNTSIGTYSADMGTNWETASFLRFPSITGNHETAYFLLGIEGGEAWPRLGSQPSTKPRATGNSRWVAVSLPAGRAKEEDGVCTPLASAALDYGSFYAPHTPGGQEDKESKMIWGWITEDNLTAEGRAAQGWAGCLSLPRDVFEQVITDVQGSLFPIPLEQTGLVVTHSAHPSTVRLLGTRPANSVWPLLLEKAATHLAMDTLHLSPADAGRRQVSLFAHAPYELGATWAVRVRFTLPSSPPARVGLAVTHHAMGSLAPRGTHAQEEEGQTLVYFDTRTSELGVERALSHARLTVDGQEVAVDRSADYGPLPLFRRRTCRRDHSDGDGDGDDDGADLELLDLLLFFDGSVLEIFANDRFALTTRIYPATAQHSILAFTEGGCVTAGPAQLHAQLPRTVLTT